MTSSETTQKLTDSNPVVISIFRDAISAAIPDALITGSEWTSAYRYVSQGPRRGEKFSMDVVPYLIEPLDCINTPGIRRIVLWSASRIAKTEGLLLNANGYFMHYDPAQIMNLRPTLDDAKLFSRERWSAFVEETPVLRGLVEDPRTRDSGNTILYKKFLGGYVFFAGANSPTGLRAQDFRILLADEIDDYPLNAGGQGDPLELAEVRLRNYEAEGQALSILCSSPTIKGESRIEEAYETSDQRRFYVPCLDCGEYQELLWSSIVWRELGLPPSQACFKCPMCGHVGPEDEKEEMVKLGEWRAHAEFTDTVGFKLLGTYSPFITWGGMAQKFINAKESKSDDTMQVWVNSTLGELWEPGQYLEEVQYAFDRDEYGGEESKFDIPAGVAYLTFGADVQDDRIEVEVLGWGLNDESWSIDYKVLLGAPGQYPSAVWDDLEDYLETDWRHELGVTMRVIAGAIDTGHATDEVYKFCYQHRRERWYAIKGSSVGARPIAPRRPSIVGKPRIKLYVIGTTATKDKTAAMLRIKEPGPRYCHTPKRYKDDWEKQMCSEQRIRITNKQGFRVWSWVVRPPGARNEAWDCRNYNVAAKEILNPNPEALRERLLKQVGEVKAREATPEPSSRPNENDDGGESGPASPPRAPSNFRSPRRRGGFIKNW